MCFGESGGDSLKFGELNYLREAAKDFPSYDFDLRTNDDDLTWAVFSPQESSARTPRFTFCRIDPCVMVMVEDQTTHRRFCSAPTVEDAVRFALDTAKRAVLAFDNVHDAPEMAQ